MDKELEEFKFQMQIFGYAVMAPKHKFLSLAQLRDRVMSGQLALMAEESMVWGWWDPPYFSENYIQ